MSEIVQSSDISKILKFAEKKKEFYSFLILEEGQSKYGEILKQKGLKEMCLESVSSEQIISSEREYIDSIAELSCEHNSIEWWANTLSEKNEHTSTHYKNLFLYCMLIKTLQECNDFRIIIECNKVIFRQLKDYCRLNGIQISSLDNGVMQDVFTNISEIICQFCKIALFMFTVFKRKMIVRAALKSKIVSELKNIRACYVIRTWIDERIIASPDFRYDAYFGNLPNYLIEQGVKVVVLAGVINNYRKIISSLKNKNDVLVIPEEYFLKYSDCLKLILLSIFRRIKLKKKIYFRGIEVTKLYQEEIRKSYRNLADQQNMLRYFIGRRLGQNLSFQTYIQTFENYAWEKLSILGIRETRNNHIGPRILGFQHAFISRNSFKYFPGEKERDIIPLPDKIITMGTVTKKIMEKYGSYKSEIFEIGCALRQEYLNNLKPFKRRRFNKILVPLTMVINESIAIITFIYNSRISETDIEVIIRPHPLLPFESFKRDLNFDIPDNYIIDNKKSLNEELSSTDIVAYTWSTVGVEALRIGLPVIYLGILKPMYVDPLFECLYLKWTVTRPDQLLPAIRGIYNMDTGEFYRDQKMSQDYLKEYFYPVNENRLSVFVDK